MPRYLEFIAVVALGFMSLMAVLEPDRREPSRPQHSQVVLSSAVSINPATGRRELNGRAFTGVAETYNSHGILIRREAFKSGRRHGDLQMWFDDGQLAFHSAYLDGKREGYTRSWWSNGNRRSATTFLNDHPHGIAWSWYPTGETFKRYQYENGKPTGLQKGWRKNGKLFSNFEYRNGRAYGLRNAYLCVELDDESINRPTET